MYKLTGNKHSDFGYSHWAKSSLTLYLNHLQSGLLQSWKLLPRSTGALNWCYSFYSNVKHILAVVGYITSLLGFFFSPLKHQVGHIPCLTMLNTPQVCIQCRSLKDATAPFLFVTLRLSPMLTISPCPAVRGAQRHFEEEKTALGGVLCLHIQKHHHIYKLLVLVVPHWELRPCCRFLDICCLHHCSLSNPPDRYGGSSIYCKSSKREVKGNILAPNGSLWWTAEHTEESRI